MQKKDAADVLEIKFKGHVVAVQWPHDIEEINSVLFQAGRKAVYFYRHKSDPDGPPEEEG